MKNASTVLLLAGCIAASARAQSSGTPNLLTVRGTHGLTRDLELFPIAQRRDAPSTGWAKGAAVWGFVSAGVVLAGGIASEEDISDDAGLAIGSATTGYFAITLPLVALGAASARHGDVPGSPPWRFVGWLGYGLTLADAALLIGLGAADVGVPGAPSSVGVLGALSYVAMSVDALTSSSQASAKVVSSRVSPTFRVATVNGKTTQGYGLRIQF